MNIESDSEQDKSVSAHSEYIDEEPCPRCDAPDPEGNNMSCDGHRCLAMQRFAPSVPDPHPEEMFFCDDCHVCASIGNFDYFDLCLDCLDSLKKYGTAPFSYAPNLFSTDCEWTHVVPHLSNKE